MKKLVSSFILLITAFAVYGQSNRTDVLQNLEKSQPSGQNIQITAILKSASRLFGAKDDLTSVIMVIPAGDTVAVIDSDSSYFHVAYQDSEGYILRRQATVNQTSVVSAPVNQQQENVQGTEPVQQQDTSRYSYLENKYGSKMAASLLSGKIWKGMSTDMVRDSWGKPQKINRVISGNTIKEEWIYTNTWLFFENDALSEWGPTKR